MIARMSLVTETLDELVNTDSRRFHLTLARHDILAFSWALA